MTSEKQLPSRESLQAELFRPELVRGFIASIGTFGVFLIFYLISMLIGKVEFLKAISLRPMDFSHFYGVITYAFGHVDFSHIQMNMTQLAILAFWITRVYGWKNYLFNFVGALLGSGLFTFFVAAPGSYVVGASGIMAGLAVYMFFRSIIEKEWMQVLISSVFIALMGISIIQSIAQNNTSLSWEAHAGGLLTGVFLAAFSVAQSSQKS